MNYLLVRCSNKIIHGVNNLFKGTLKKFKSSYWGHKISKSTSVDCNKIYVVTVKSKKIVRFPHYSYTVGPYGKGPTGDYSTCTYSS